jgi:ABC-type lipoprotein release transport system permease subunit
VPNPAESAAKIQALGLTAAPRLYGVGLAAFKDQSAGAELRGIDVEAERKVSRLHEHLEHGAWLESSDPQGVVLGKQLARRLTARIGDEIVLLSQAADGSMSDALFKVKGILKSVSARADEGGFFMVEASYRNFMALPEGSHEIAVRSPLADPDLDALEKSVAAALPGLESLGWRRLKPSSASILDAQKVGMFIFMAIAYFSVGMVIFNAMLMNVFERIREFGVMKAIGVTPGMVLKLVYAEALMEAVLAALMALGLGVPIALRFQVKGLDLSGLSEGGRISGMVLEPILYTNVSVAAVWQPIAFLFVLSAIAVAYPAGKAAMLQPVKAIYHR